MRNFFWFYAILLSACGGSDKAVQQSTEQHVEKKTPPSIEGLITWTADRSADLGRGQWRLQVEVDPSDKLSDGGGVTPKAEITVNPDTRLLSRDARGDYQAINRSQISVGSLARVWYVPGLPILDSYPEQAQAEVISVESGRNYKPPPRTH